MGHSSGGPMVAGRGGHHMVAPGCVMVMDRRHGSRVMIVVTGHGYMGHAHGHGPRVVVSASWSGRGTFPWGRGSWIIFAGHGVMGRGSWVIIVGHGVMVHGSWSRVMGRGSWSRVMGHGHGSRVTIVVTVMCHRYGEGSWA